jgi:ribosomal protein L24
MAHIKNNDTVKIIKGINKGITGMVQNHRVNGIEIFEVVCEFTGANLAFNTKTILFSSADVELLETEKDFDENSLVPDYIKMDFDKNGLPIITIK